VHQSGIPVEEIPEDTPGIKLVRSSWLLFQRAHSEKAHESSVKSI